MSENRDEPKGASYSEKKNVSCHTAGLKKYSLPENNLSCFFYCCYQGSEFFSKHEPPLDEPITNYVSFRI